MYERIAREHPELAERFRERRHMLDEHMKEKNSEIYALIVSMRKKKQ